MTILVVILLIACMLLWPAIEATINHIMYHDMSGT
jgi:hypothetical protein